jgi:hypothetical protein
VIRRAVGGSIDLSDVEARLGEAISEFDGKTLTLDGAAGPLTLQVKEVTAADGSTVIQLVDAADPASVPLFESSQLSFAIAELGELKLADRTAAGVITLDATAAGYGWFSGDKDTAPGTGDPGIDLLSERYCSRYRRSGHRSSQCAYS